MTNIDEITGRVFILIVGSIVGISERVVAWRWLRAETCARRARFFPWAVLTLLLPIVGVGAYLLLRPRGRLCRCPHCQAPSPASRSHCLHCEHAWPSLELHDQESLSWQLPNHATIPLAAIAALAMTMLTTSSRLYQQSLWLTAPTIVIAVGGTFAVLIGMVSWFLVKTQRAAWQDNPLALVLVASALGPTTYLLSGARSAGMLMVAAAILSLVAALAVSSIMHLALYDVRRSVIGLILGYIVGMVAHIMATPAFGLLHARFMFMALCIAPFMLAAAIMSARGRMASVPNPSSHIAFLNVAAPLWGLLCLSLLVSLVTNR